MEVSGWKLLSGVIVKPLLEIEIGEPVSLLCKEQNCLPLYMSRF
jgi:hypothetical protein